uniref:Transmembrane 4 L6 family member 5-like n=1 Tax=Leptobrachium leishanense TaxID=445787 RepID=A0A8C5PDQ7_9ANUR
MCTGKCAKCIGISLYPLCVISIAANLMMFFPDWSTEYIQNANQQITQEVRSVGGIVGGGVLVLFTAVQIQATGRKGCCGNRCGMFLSILFAVIGLGGALFGFLMSFIGLFRGPACLYNPSFINDDLDFLTNGSTTSSLIWGRPFESLPKNFSDENYLFDSDLWEICVAPANIVEFNIILFSIIMGATGFEIMLCFTQMLNGLFGCICGTCLKKKNEKEDAGEFHKRNNEKEDMGDYRFYNQNEKEDMGEFHKQKNEKEDKRELIE